MSDPRPTLDQLQVFLAIVDAGSFAAAARRLGRATSVVSYTIANLEAQLGLELFDRDSTRKPALTEAGRAILGDTRTITMRLGDLVAKAKGLHAGLEAEVALVVDVMLPPCSLVQVLDAFQIEFPTVALRLYVEALGAVTQHVLDGIANVGICGPVEFQHVELRRSQVGAVRLIPVAAPSHPLSRMGEEADMHVRDHIQLVLTDRSSLTRGQDFQVMAMKTWRLADLGAKYALLKAGIGWGSMPEEMVRDDIENGRLVRLAVTAWDNAIYRLQSIYRTNSPPGPAARWLLDRLKDTLAPV
ncbi:LysR family transcriptional regulator [Labrys monachus]|uniref:DNA-binding transcriptional LysR family regulator n=1 Tax=Labrys monachus TaxID=217067 RepID=A0ABU0FLP4_9HYPH|nr:LysR family transcriptional regulator [Labrys monachus]MDQ0395028.1 DNA-binding transcriptional LysR family regulator [Labrys monachus]